MAIEAAVGAEETEKILRGERRVTATCGSGMTAGVLWLGLQLLGVKQVGLYDEVSNDCQLSIIHSNIPCSHGPDMPCALLARYTNRCETINWVGARD